MNKIQQEIKDSKEIIKFTYYKDEKELVELTRNNVALAEAIINYDSDYKDAINKNVEGTSANVFSQIKNDWNFMGPNEKLKKETIESLIRIIDRENATHLNADRCGYEEIVERLMKCNKKDFEKMLKYPDVDYTLVQILAEKTSSGRRNLSFASKFCQLFCFNIFEDTEFQDNYCKYDSVVRRMLPHYQKYFKTPKRILENNYKNFCLTIDEIITASGSNISRHGFDQLIWYIYK